MTTGARRTLIAGVGNIFFSDDGFGVEVAKRLAECELPEGVTVADYGISGMHLAYDLCDVYDRAILIDATPRGGTPGTVYVLEHDQPGEADPCTALFNAHGPETARREPLAVAGAPARVAVADVPVVSSHWGLVAAAWTLVGVPLAWGVFKTLTLAAQMF